MRDRKCSSSARDVGIDKGQEGSDKTWPASPSARCRERRNREVTRTEMESATNGSGVGALRDPGKVLRGLSRDAPSRESGTFATVRPRRTFHASRNLPDACRR